MKILGTYDMWRYSELSNNKSDKHVALTTYSKYMRVLISTVEDILLEGGSVYLPNNFGAIRLKKFKPTGVLWDWQKTRRLWENDPIAKANKLQVMISVSHTDGYAVKLQWSKYNMKFKNKSLLRCKRTRGFRDRTNKALLDNPKLIGKIKR